MLVFLGLSEEMQMVVRQFRSVEHENDLGIRFYIDSEAQLRLSEDSLLQDVIPALDVCLAVNCLRILGVAPCFRAKNVFQFSEFLVFFQVLAVRACEHREAAH